ncbi:hypothetical protein MKZ38_008092 [Zalerion maritima]|uniref:Uncharacterized protein n=1 Tax=Zalerion maritima TaxID=339359 RepID=A0AAD5RWF4_9PEZI|nr:hypothetical protein MKZ38_008092 [Zalerion maritima]
MLSKAITILLSGCFGLGLTLSAASDSDTYRDPPQESSDIPSSMSSAQAALKTLGSLLPPSPPSPGNGQDSTPICLSWELVKLKPYRGLSGVVKSCPPTCETGHGAPVDAVLNAYVQLNWTTELGECSAKGKSCEKLLCKYGKAAIWFCNELEEEECTVDCNFPATVARYIYEECRFKDHRSWFVSGKAVAYTPEGVMFRTEVHHCGWPDG